MLEGNWEKMKLDELGSVALIPFLSDDDDNVKRPPPRVRSCHDVLGNIWWLFLLACSCHKICSKSVELASHSAHSFEDQHLLWGWPVPSCEISQCIKTLHLLQADARIQYKVCSLCLNAINSSGTQFLLTYLRFMHLLTNPALLLTLVHCAFLQYTQKHMAKVPFQSLHLLCTYSLEQPF